MENNNNKIATVSFMVAAVLIAIVVSVLMNTLAAVTTGGFGRFVAQDAVRHGLPAVIGLVCFFAFQFNKGVATWADEVITEIRRVVWPSRKDTVAMTIVVCIMLIISGVFFGILDVVSGSVVDWVLHQNFLGVFS
ncbi:MAG: preprotein translocase subunit SecE [Bdellovibrionota bacterium]